MTARLACAIALVAAMLIARPVAAQRVQRAEPAAKRGARAAKRPGAAKRPTRTRTSRTPTRRARKSHTRRAKSRRTNWARRRRIEKNSRLRRRLTVSHDPDTDARMRRKAARARQPERKPDKLPIKNRGKLATLKGIYKGKKYRLVNPTTGKLDAKAQVISTGTNKWTKVPFAMVKFSNGHKAKYAAERLHLVGRSTSFQRKYIRGRRRVLFGAIEKQLGVPVEGVELKSLRGRNVQPNKRKLVNGRNAHPHLGPFLTALGEKLSPREGLLGYQVDGKATVSRHHAAFDIATPTHEVLHGLSQRFIDQMFEKNLVNTLEGITDYFTFKVVRPHYGVQQKPSDAYRKYTVFATRIADKIGEDKLKSIFFAKRGNLVQKLSTAVDKAVGKKGAFLRAARKLEKGKLVEIE